MLAYRFRYIDVLFCNLALSCANGLPEFVIDNAQVRNLGDDPFAFRVQARHALAGPRVLDVAKPVPDQLADIKLVVEDAGSMAGMAADRGVIPQLVFRAGNTFCIQRSGNWARADPGGEVAKNTSDDFGLLFVNLPVAPDRFSVRVLQDHLDIRPQDHGGTGDRRILVTADNLSTLAFYLISANAELILDRGFVLIIGGIPGVDRNTGHRLSFYVRLPFREGSVGLAPRPIFRDDHAIAGSSR